MDYDISSDIVNIMTSEYAIYANNLTTIWLDSYCPIPGKTLVEKVAETCVLQLFGDSLTQHSLRTSNLADCLLITDVPLL